MLQIILTLCHLDGYFLRMRNSGMLKGTMCLIHVKLGSLCCFIGWSNTSLLVSVHYAVAGLHSSEHLQTGDQETPKTPRWRLASSRTQITHAEVRHTLTHTHAHSLTLRLSSLFPMVFCWRFTWLCQTVIGACSMNKDLLWRLKSTIGFCLKYIPNQAALKCNRGVWLFNVMYQGCCF